MKIHYGAKIFAGLIVFLLLFATPFLMNMGKAEYKQPELKLPTKEAVAAFGMDKYECIESTEFMRENHMQLLDHWRDAALRDGKRIYVNSEGKQIRISLQNTCMKCHTNMEDFCGKCHDNAGVSPYCWDCHTVPEGLKK